MNTDLVILVRVPASAFIYGCCRGDLRALESEKTACISITTWPVLETKVLFSSLNQKNEEDGLKLTFTLRCKRQILTKPKGDKVTCCLSSYYLSFPTYTLPFLKGPFQDVFLRCQNFPLPIADIFPTTQKGRRLRRTGLCLILGS